MKYRLSMLSMVLCLTLMSQAQMWCHIDTKPFDAGETLQYKLYYNWGPVWIQAGACEFAVRSATYNSKPVFQLMIHGKTQKSFDSFFKVRDTLVSYVDQEKLIPYKAFKYAHEDNWHGIDEFTFRKDTNGWNITTRLKRKKQWREPEESRTTRCGFDLVSSIYRLRALSDEKLYVIGRRLEIPVRLDDDEYNMYLTYQGKERIKLFGGGHYTAHAFSLTLVAGNVFKRGDVLKMWISDDGNKIPLLIQSPIRVGSVKALFQGGENTLFPLSKPQ
ncbi:MAG: DUF3108 domain-containing protein [Bacteroidales bacterium]|nr:DUF3108 domain-containing protein [Bacteroidales bacterium]